jgi:leucyl-tRNA synthetase
MHLLYARFWTKALHDAGLIPFVEPFQALRNQGMLLAPDPKDPGAWIKMSKSKGNVITPDEIAARYGADSLRVYELFVAPMTDSIQWSEDGINGMYRFLSRTYRLVQDHQGRYDPQWRKTDRQEMLVQDEDRNIARKTHQTIRKVTEDIESLDFNTAVAALMELMNELSKYGRTLTHDGPSAALSEGMEMLVLLLAPMAPHVADELWEQLGHEGFTATQPWPEYDADIAKADEITVVIQVNGKLRDRISVAPETAKEDLEALALASPKVRTHLEDKSVRKVIVVQDRLVNIVAG